MKKRRVFTGLMLVFALIFTMFAFTGCGSGYKSAVSNFEKAFEGGDEVVLNTLPEVIFEFLAEQEDMDADDLRDEYLDMWEEGISNLEDMLGDDLKIKCKVTDKKELTDSKLKKIKDVMKESYDVSKKRVTSGYSLDLEIKLSGDDDDFTEDFEVAAIQIDGGWYLFEKNGLYEGFGKDNELYVPFTLEFVGNFAVNYGEVTSAAKAKTCISWAKAIQRAVGEFTMANNGEVPTSKDQLTGSQYGGPFIDRWPDNEPKGAVYWIGYGSNPIHASTILRGYEEGEIGKVYGRWVDEKSGTVHSFINGVYNIDGEIQK